MFGTLTQATQQGIRDCIGPETAKRIADAGFDRLHEFVDPAVLPDLTNAVYKRVAEVSPGLLRRLAPDVLGLQGPFYFERLPNIRFHIPFDLAKRHRKQFDRFADQHGQGKIAPHGPHRDSWLDCPSNAINIWCAIGPVKLGNGLSIYQDVYNRDLRHRKNGEIDYGQSVGRPVNYTLEPGDCLVFHGDHVHGSELNRIDSTRYVISFRLTPGKPRFPLGHHHHYVHSRLSAYLPRLIAEVPAKLQWSFLRHNLQRLAEMLMLSRPKHNGASNELPHGVGANGRVADLGNIAVGEIVPVSPKVCLARLGEDEFAAVGRRCPHKGGDMADGFVEGRSIVCPWHNVPFDTDTGKSPCDSLASLPVYDVEVSAGQAQILDRRHGG